MRFFPFSRYARLPADLKIGPRHFWRDIQDRIQLSEPSRGPRLVGLIITLLVMASYNIIFYNRFLPLSEGWFSVYAVSMLHGQVPYRDFYLLIPPLYPLSLAAFIHFFGQGLIALRILGIFLILAIATLIFLILSRYFSAYVAAFVSIVSMVYYQSGNEHITYDFTQFLTFYALLSGYLLIVGLEMTGNSARLGLKCSLAVFLSGVFAALMALTKQSNGAPIFVFLVMAVTVPALAFGARYSLYRAALFLSGAVVPVAAVCAWLYHESALNLFWHQIFFDATSAKGHLVVILFSWMKPFVNAGYIHRIISVCLSIAVLMYVEFVLRKSMPARRFFPARGYLYFLGVVLVTSFAIFAPLFYPALAPERFGWKLLRNIHFAGASAAIVFCLLHFFRLAGGEKKNVGLFVVSALSMGLVFGNGTSAGVTQISLFLPLALLLAYLLSAASFLHSIQAVVVGLSFMLTLTLAASKYAHPYSWWGLAEPDIRQSRIEPDIDALKGFVVSPGTARAFSIVSSIIKSNTTVKDSIFTFPNIPIFYLLTDRWPKTMAKVHWFDFLSDSKAAGDARALRDNPPKIFVNLELPQDVWLAHESLFRGGKAMGQREILCVITELTTHSNGKYQLEASIPIPNGCNLKVWKRTE